MQSPAVPVSKKISGRSGDSESKSSDASDFERILNIEAVTTEEEKVDTNDQDSIDSSASTVTEDKNPAPAGSQASQGSNSSDSEDDGSSTSESSDSNSESDISSSSSSDSASDSIDSDSSIATTKMSSTLKSPVCDGSRESFEEWHSQWEVYAGDNKIDEYISVVFLTVPPRSSTRWTC